MATFNLETNNTTQKTTKLTKYGAIKDAALEITSFAGNASSVDTALRAVSGAVIGTGIYGRGGSRGVWGTGPIGVMGTAGQSHLTMVRPHGSHASLQCGVYGTASSGPGVKGVANSTGVEGESTHGVGVRGVGGGDGVVGFSATKTGVRGEGGECGVVGRTNTGTGVFGGAGDPAIGGPLHFAVGVRAHLFQQTGPGIGLVSTVPSGYTAGQFIGDVEIQGNLTVFGGAKSAAVKFSDGGYRALYAIESPESWFEDFGAGKLKRGAVRIALDRQFASTIDTKKYHVFLQPQGECQGLYVKRMSTTDFEVAELGGGRSSVRFSYRIVAKRKDVKAPRFAKVSLVKVPPPQKSASTRSRLRKTRSS